MLAPNDRTLYTQCLSAPEGYRFDHGVATTFSLDLETLLVLPFTLATQSAADPAALLVDPVALLESIREVSSRLSVFHQAGYAAVPRKEQLLFGLLEESVFAAKAPGGGAFHPKLWLLRFVPNEGGDRPLLRAVVLSRNLTFDRSWDTVLCLEGEPGRRAKESDGLRDLVAALPGLVSTDDRLSDERRLRIEQLAAEAAQTSFAAPAPFRGQARFHAIGVPAHRAFEPGLDYARRLLCVSPFVTREALSKARGLIENGLASSEWHLIARADELDALSDEALDGWNPRVVDEGVQDGESGEEAELSDDVAHRVPPRGLHAKLVIVENTQDTVSWWVGSANLSGSAWKGRNVELMVELSTTKKHGGIDVFLEDGFGKLLSDWKRSEPDEAELAKRQALEALSEARDEIAAAPWSVAASEAEGGWRLALSGGAPLRDNVRAKVWPVTQSERIHAQELSAGVAWSPLSAASLTGLMAFELSAKHPRGEVCIRFVLKLPTSGFPADRIAHIVGTIVDSRASFFRYLRLLLAAATGEVAMLGADRVVNGRGEGERGAAGFLLEEVVLEDLIRMVSRSPERLDAIDRLLEDLSKTEQGREAIPPDFAQLWQEVRKARPRSGA